MKWKIDSNNNLDVFYKNKYPELCLQSLFELNFRELYDATVFNYAIEEADKDKRYKEFCKFNKSIKSFDEYLDNGYKLLKKQVEENEKNDKKFDTYKKLKKPKLYQYISDKTYIPYSTVKRIFEKKSKSKTRLENIISLAFFFEFPIEDTLRFVNSAGFPVAGYKNDYLVALAFYKQLVFEHYKEVNKIKDIKNKEEKKEIENDMKLADAGSLEEFNKFLIDLELKPIIIKDEKTGKKSLVKILC